MRRPVLRSPVLPDLAFEIISPEQSFGMMREKATAYLTSRVSRVWIVDPRARSITVFYPDASPQTFTCPDVIEDNYLETLKLIVADIFEFAG